MAILDQAIEAARTFQPLSRPEVSALLAKTKDAAMTGEFEPFKTTHQFDGTAQNPQMDVIRKGGIATSQTRLGFIGRGLLVRGSPAGCSQPGFRRRFTQTRKGERAGALGADVAPDSRKRLTALAWYCLASPSQGP
jgi:hypothetical protein